MDSTNQIAQWPRSPKSWLWPAAAIAFLFVFYADGLRTWFVADDFAWLGLLRQVHGADDVFRILFGPAAQGTLRPFSDRGYFLLIESLFGPNSVAFKMVSFATMSADLVLVWWLVGRLTRSDWAAFTAMIAWTVNGAMSTALSWTATYGQLMCPLFLLSALVLFARYVETGDRRYWWAQLVVFFLGFGALEINIVYPVIAAAWILFAAGELSSERRRRLLLSVLPMFGLSVAFLVVHSVTVPYQKSGPYALHFDLRMAKTLFLYTRWSLVPAAWDHRTTSRFFGSHAQWAGYCLSAAVACGVGWLLWTELARRRFTVLFFATWYLATLGPLLPLSDHRTDYYLTIPLAGLAMLAGWGVACAQTAPVRARAAAAIAFLAYFGANVPVALAGARQWRERSEPVRGLVLGVEAAAAAHPGKVIAVDGLTQDLYRDSLGSHALYPFGVDSIYLAPGAERNLQPGHGITDPAEMALTPESTLRAIGTGQIRIYSPKQDHLKNVTQEYGKSLASHFAGGLPDRADAGNPLDAWLLGGGWFPVEEGVRWMNGRASVRLRGPAQAGSKVALEGHFAAGQLEKAPTRLSVSVGSDPVGTAEMRPGDTDFHVRFPLPDAWIGKPEVVFTIQVEPMNRIDGQDYGALFGKIAITR
jgi:hypothetical protein